MANSLQYKDLVKRIKHLRQQFLPSRFSRTGSYSDEIVDNARAFRMLVHAELEYYVESRASAIALRARDSWIKSGNPSVSLICLLADRSGNLTGIGAEVGTKRTAATVVGETWSKFQQRIKDNNGIRTTNILRLLLPIGIKENEIDTVWLGTIDSFGKNRGDTAHTTSVSHSVDPKGEYVSVNQIMQGIKPLDRLLSELESSIQ
jgi:RiboL-PSP-HEPN